MCYLNGEAHCLVYFKDFTVICNHRYLQSTRYCRAGSPFRSGYNGVASSAVGRPGPPHFYDNEDLACDKDPLWFTKMLLMCP